MHKLFFLLPTSKTRSFQVSSGFKHWIAAKQTELPDACYMNQQQDYGLGGPKRMVGYEQKPIYDNSIL